MAKRMLIFVIGTALLVPALVAKEEPRTWATRRVIDAKAFSIMRAKARETTLKKKKQRSPKTRDAKAGWGQHKR